ncbi:DinB family protein [Bacillus suaedaesalsae]|uniref:DinB family protein n=1 Tax=Bacillus suaedaesalsae TaxID=2810349 RepID=A0ABS2DP26_9BACI|nr:DinB family protein [Bacillus suaedaesalsae]MBM6619363.1 DinB family protein [Bacillus suaedaesalsae]
MLIALKEKLLENRTVLLRFIEKLDEEDLKCSKKSGWTVSEVIEHIFLVEKNVTKGIRYYANQPKNEPAEEKPIHLVLDRTRKIEAPSTVRPKGGSISMQKHFENLNLSREFLFQTLEEIDEHLLTQRSFPHETFGPLTLLQWIEVLAYHDIRHLEQLKDILNDVGK